MSISLCESFPPASDTESLLQTDSISTTRELMHFGIIFAQLFSAVPCDVRMKGKTAQPQVCVSLIFSRRLQLAALPIGRVGGTRVITVITWLCNSTWARQVWRQHGTFSGTVARQNNEDASLRSESLNIMEIRRVLLDEASGLGSSSLRALPCSDYRGHDFKKQNRHHAGRLPEHTWDSFRRPFSLKILILSYRNNMKTM